MGSTKTAGPCKLRATATDGRKDVSWRQRHMPPLTEVAESVNQCSTSQSGRRLVPVNETHLTDAVFGQLRQAMASDPVGFTALYRDYLADAWCSLRCIRDSVQARQGADVRAKAHYLRSSSLVLGAQGVARFAGRLEEAALTSDSEQFDVLLDKIKMALDSVQVELAERLGSGVLPADRTAA